MSFIHLKKRPRQNKFKAKPTNGFSSKLEASVYECLKMRERIGEIKDIKCQQTVVLQEGSRDVRITWRVDFSFTDLRRGGATSYAEAKGIETSDYKLKLKLWKANPPGALEIWKGHYSKPFIVEVIEPKKAGADDESK